MADQTNPYLAVAARLAEEQSAAAPRAELPRTRLQDNPYAAAARDLAAELRGAAPPSLVERALGGTMGARPGPTTARAELAGTTRMGPTVNNAQALTILRRADQLLQEGASPDVVAEVRKVARETGDSLPLAAQTYAERAARISDDRGAALLAANPGLAKLVDRRGYADLAKDLEGLAAAEQAAQGWLGTLVLSPASRERINTTAEPPADLSGFAGLNVALERGLLRFASAPAYVQLTSTMQDIAQIGMTADEIYAGLVAERGVPEDQLQPWLAATLRERAQMQADKLAGYTQADIPILLERAADSLQTVAQLRDIGRRLGQSESAKRFNDALSAGPDEIGAFFAAVGNDPAGAAQFLSETIVESAPILVAGMAIGAATGSRTLAALTSGGASFSLENVTTAMDYIAEQGYEIQTIDDARAVLGNQELMAEAQRRGLARGVIIGALDAISGGIAGIALSRSALADVTLQAGVQGSLAAGGEILGSLAATGEYSPQAALIEAIADVGPTPLEITGIGLRQFGERRAAAQALQDRLDATTRAILSQDGLQRAADRAAEQQEALETTRAAIEETATFARDPEAVRELLEAAGDQEVSIPVQEIERLYQEGALTDDDIAYLQVEDELTQQGDLSGDVSTTASRVLTLQGDAFARLSEHVRTQPGAPTTAEAREALANREADIERLQGVLEQAQAAADEVGVLSERIAAEVRAAAPQYTAAQGRAMGRLLAERYAARAALFEPGTTAQSLYERDKVAFEAAGQAAPAQTLEQAAASVGMRTPEFQTWFADSKVVDDAGQPLVVYHGTASAFEAFDPGRTGQGDPGFLGSGFYFGDNRSIARSYAMMRPGTDERVIEAHLSLQNPFMWGPKGLGVRGFVQDGDRLPDAIHDEVVRRSGYGTERIPSSEYEAAERTVSRVVREVLEERGYDGVIATDDFSSQPIEFVAFRPEQIKDVTNERPTAAPSMFEQEGLPLFDNPLQIEGRVTVRAIAEGMTEAHMQAYGRQLFPEDSPEDYAEVLRVAREELAAQLQQPNSGHGWYSKDVDLAIQQTARILPGLDTKEGRAAFLTFAGIFSNGLDPQQAWQISIEAYEAWQATGEIILNRADAARAVGREPRMTSFKDKAGNKVTQPAGWGPRNAANEQQLQMFKTLIEQQGSVTAALDWLVNPQSRADINQLMADAGVKTPRFKTKAEREGPPTYGALIFSEKLGRYTLGLHGVPVGSEDTTVDLWYTRTYRRWTGRLLEKPIGKEGVAAQPDPARGGIERQTIFSLTGDLMADYPELTAGDVQAMLWFFEKRLWGAQGLRTDEGTNSAGARQALEARGLEFDERGGGLAPGAEGGAAVALEQPAVEPGGTGSYSGGGLAPLEGAPNVVGAAGPDPELVAVAERYAADNGIDLRRQAEFVEVDPERAARIAQAYEEMPHAPQDTAVQAAYADLIQQTLAQYQALVDAGYSFTFFDSETDPYAGNPWNAMRDLRANKTMAVYGTYDGYGTEGLTQAAIDDNPMLQDTGLVWKDQGGVDRPVTANDLFRAVHDAFGHGIEGAGFRARGEENAWQAHVRLFTGPAVAVLTSETRGQNSWLNYGPFGEQNRTASVEDTVFAPQKAGIMPEFTWTEGRAADEAAPTAAAAAAPTLEQPTEGPQTPERGAVGAPRGQYILPTSDDPRNLIQLSTQADPSTFVHEVGHMFLFQMLRDLQDPRITAEGRAQIEAQIAATRAWFESNAEQGLSDLKALAKSIDRRAKANKADTQLQTRAARLNAAVERANAGGGAAYMQRVAQSFMDPQGAGYDEAAEVVYHELWARGFEQYLGTGSAPSAELRGVFAKFAKYITSIYKSLRRLNVTVSPEVADVFDRLLATEDAINAERRGALYQVSPGVLEGATPAEANELRRLAAEAEDEARTQMAARVENSLRAEERAKRRARRKEIANEISLQVAAEPTYAAINIARRGVMPDGKELGTGKISRTEFLAVSDENSLARMPKGMVSDKVAPDKAIPLGDLATLAGFPDIDTMINALTNPTPPPAADAVELRVDAQMEQEFGADLDADALQTKAVEVAQNDKFQQLQQLQLRILRRLATQPMQRLAQRQAEQQGAPAAAADTAAAEAARAEQAAARTPREGVQAALARIRADVQRTANASQRRAQAAAGRTTRGIQRNVDPAAVEAAAERFVANLKVKDATPARYRQAASRLTTKIERAIAARNYTEASSLMEQRALNLAVAKRAAVVQSKIEQQRTRWREVTARSDKRLAQRYSIDWINAIRVMLEPFGMARSTPRNYDANKALAALASVEPTLLAEIKLTLATYNGRAQAARQAIPNAPYKDLGVQEALDMLETADTMLANARDSYGILVEGRRVEFAAISDEIAVNVGQRRKVQKQARAEARGRGTRAFRATRRKISGFTASLRRIELWARDIDNGNPRGPMTRYLVRPVMRAVDAYTEARRGPQEALANLLRGRTDLMARKPIKATELDGYVFQSKGELLMALLHTGNPSNKRKLLLGGAEDVANRRKYVWGSLDADGNLDTTRWDRFTARLFAEGTLTKADMDLVQGIWDIFEQTKKPAQAAHKQMYGYYFTEIEAEPLITPVGTYRGGYAPAVTDVMMNSDGNRFEAEEVMSQQSNAAMFPGAEKGFTQSRTEYNKPLDLDLTRIPAHFDRVMKFAYLGPAVRQAARLVTSPAFREAVRPASLDVIDVAVIPWLQRTVQQLVTTPPANQGSSLTSSIAAAIDRRVGLHVMAGNLVNAAQQVTGFSVATARIPARHIAVAFTQWRVDNQSARAYILSRSTFMQDRLTGGMNEASTTLESILTEPGLLNKAQNAAMRYGYFAQQMVQNLVDPTVWLAAERHGMETVYPAAYAEALERTGDEAAADAAARAEVAEYADSVVRDTQAPLRPSDISGIEASSPLARIFLKFYSYFNAMGNLLVAEKNITVNSEIGWAGRYGRSFYAYLLIMYIPTVVAESISQLARGGFDDLDDEDERNQLLFEIFIGSQIKTLAATVPYFGALVSTTYGVAVTEQVYDDRINLSAGIGVTESTVTNVVRLIKAAADPDTDVDTRRAIRATLDAMGLAVGLPTGWAAKPISYAASVAEGDSDPEGLVDIVQGVLTGRDGTER